MSERQVDVAIIGSGSAGLYALGKVRPSGKTWVLINGGDPGTTCARVGCMPSKALIQVAEDYHRRTLLGHYGVDGHEGLNLDLPEAMQHVQELRDTFVDRVLSNSTDKMGDEYIRGYARFLAPDLLQVDNGERIRAKRIIIATGSRPQVPQAWRAFGAQVLTTDDLFEQEDLPASLAVIGMGTIGLELGQSLQRLGIQVTGFDQLETIGGAQDPEVLTCALELMRKEFPIHLGHRASLSQAEDGRLRVSAGPASVVVDKVLAAMGRVPNLDGLGLENLGCALDQRGIPVYDPQTMQVGKLPVFIAGDVTGDRPVLHEAGDEGRIAGHNAVSDHIESFRRKVPLFINFCDPNICIVGARWNELDPATTVVGQVRMAPVGRALIMGKNRGIIRVYGERSSGRLLGAEMIAAKGENLALLLSWCIMQNLTVGDLLRMPFYHPVIEEALQAALYDLYAKVETKNPGGIPELIPV
jgi:dihydrolipoamide dehydrogenase